MKKCLLKRAFLCLISGLMFLFSFSFKTAAYDPKDIINGIQILNNVYDRYKDFKTKSIINETIYALMDLYKYVRNTDTYKCSLGDDAQNFINYRVGYKFKNDYCYKRFFNFERYYIDKTTIDPILNLGKDINGKSWIIANDKQEGNLLFNCL